MKFCPHCDKELPAQTGFCPHCGKSLSGSPIFTNLSKKFWMIFIGVIGAICFSLLDWINIPLGYGYAVNFNLFSLWGKLEDSGLNLLFGGLQEFENAKTFLLILAIALVMSFVLQIISLVRHQSKESATLSYLGFGLSALVPLIFIVVVMNITKEIDGTGLTIFPFLTIACALAAMILVLTHSDQRSAVKNLCLHKDGRKSSWRYRNA